MTAGDMTYILWHKGTACIKSTEGAQIINTDGTPLRKIWSTTSHTNVQCKRQLEHNSTHNLLE